MDSHLLKCAWSATFLALALKIVTGLPGPIAPYILNIHKQLDTSTTLVLNSYKSHTFVLFNESLFMSQYLINKVLSSKNKKILNKVLVPLLYEVVCLDHHYRQSKSMFCFQEY